MFTGLIESTGTVLALKPVTGAALRVIIAAPELAGRWKIGDSIAVNGVCLTAVDMRETWEPHPGRFAADLAQETIERTTLARLQPGALVNLELPTPSGSPLGGHVVQGHVDGVGKLLSMRPLSADRDRTDWRMSIELPDALAASVIPQGSITVDGISLTVAKMVGNCIEIAIIPHTYKSTNLRALMAGSLVNIETDVLSRYAVKQIALRPTLHAMPWRPEANSTLSSRPEANSTLSSRPERSEVERPAVATWHETTPAPPRHPPAGWLTPDYLMSNGY